jgi:hypothetical protein
VNIHRDFEGRRVPDPCVVTVVRAVDVYQRDVEVEMLWVTESGGACNESSWRSGGWEK